MLASWWSYRTVRSINPGCLISTRSSDKASWSSHHGIFQSTTSQVSTKRKFPVEGSRCVPSPTLYQKVLVANAVFIIISILIIAFSGEQLPTNIVQYREELAVDSATLKKVYIMSCTNVSQSSFYFFPIIVRDECYPYFTCLHRCSPTHLGVSGDYSSRDCSTLVLLVQLLQRRGGKLHSTAFWSYP